MSVPSVEMLQRYLCRLCDEAGQSDDSVLLNRFVSANDREAFALLIARHGPMVLGTARRFVDNPHDAEDVFQAVFLSLARLAKTIRQGSTLPAWLHKATCRIAAKARKNRACGSGELPPEPCQNIDPAARLIWQEVRQALDEELQHLPEPLRSPLLLCYLSGLTRDEAATQLGWSLGTLKRRLEAGRKALRIRLERRGIASVGLALTVLAPETLQAATSKSLLEATLRLTFSTGTAVPATIAALVVGSATPLKGLVMKAVVALFAALAVGVAIYASKGQADPAQIVEAKKEAVKPAQTGKVVQQDGPLPAGSVLRFGTSRFRHGVSIGTMAVTADGKTAYVASGSRSNGSIHALDLDTGRTLFDVGGEGEGIAIAPDGRTIVIKANHYLYVRAARTGQLLRTIEVARKSNLWSEADVLAFTPDGKAIATITDSKDIHLIDFASGKRIRDFSHENPESSNGFPQVLAVAFSPDGKQMATGGYANIKDNYFARLWDVETGKEIRRFMHGKQGYGIRCLAFSPDGKTLATLGTQAGVFLRLFDVETGKQRRAFPKDGNQRTSPRSVAFAPDGKTVAVAGASIRLYDPTTGKERLRIDQKASNLHFTDGGQTLTGALSGAIYRWDTATGKALTPEAGESVVEKILVTPDGRRVVTLGEDGHGHVWDGTNGKHLRRIPIAWRNGLAMTPDGRFLACTISDSSVTFTVPHEPRSTFDGSRIRLYDLVADRWIDRFPAFKGDAKDLAFTNDGKKLVSIDQHAGMVRMWDFKAGKEERSFHVVPDDLKKQSFSVWRTQLSRDGKTAVVTYVQNQGGRLGGLRGPPQLVRFWDVASGKQLPQLDGGSPGERTFSPDGRLVLSGRDVHEMATGRRVMALPDEPSIRAAAFSVDGRLLATAVHPGVIQIWEVATWTKRNEFKGHDNRSITLTFGPGGRLFTGNRDTTVLAWETQPPRVADSVSLERAWNDLATREASVSYKSAGRWLATPVETVKFFAAKFKPVEALDPRRIQRLLVDLNSDEFAVREAASQALHGLDEQAKPYLEEALKNPKSPEVRARVKRILERGGAAITPEKLRQLRGVMVLEQLGDGASKNLLKRWAGGPGGALLTVEASAALKRLEAVSRSNQ